MKKIVLFAINLGFLLISLLVYHLAFLLKYSDVRFNIKDLSHAFIVGARFDLATCAYVMVPFAALMFLPFFSMGKKYLKMLSVLNLFWLVLINLYLFIDFLYYPFSLRHLSFELFNTGGDTLSMIKLGFLEYLPQISALVLFLAAMSFAYFSLVRKTLGNFSKANCSLIRKVLVEAVGLVIIASLSVVMARGGLQMKPLKYSDAFVFNSVFLGHLALNGAYTTMRTYYSFRENREMKGWDRRYCTEQEALQKGQELVVAPEREDITDPKYPISRRFKYKTAEFRPLNVVVFIMESWTGRYVGASGGEEDATPFFTRLSRDGVFFKNFFSNGQRSIEAISAILTSVPPSGGMILSQSGALAQMSVKFLPALLKEKGYGTFFIHGGKKGTMGFDSLVKQVGIERDISKEDIRSEGGRDDGVWGIYDEDTFLYANKLFSSQNRPFLGVIFSLSSHAPYRLPSESFRYYKPDRPFYEFLNTLRYSDYALSRFFEEAAKAPYFHNTLFVIVGDHTEGKSAGDTLRQRYSVPCLLYAPSLLKPLLSSKVVTQTDLVPTILDVLRSSDLHSSFGQSAFNDRPGIGLLSYGDSSVFVKDGWMLTSSINGPAASYNYQKDEADNSLHSKEEVLAVRRQEGYYLQFFHDLIMNNRLSPSPGKYKR